jgi:hypothetical protein
MALSVKLTGPQLRALRILAEHDPGWVRDDPLTTADTIPCVFTAVAEELGALYLADPHVSNHQVWWSIRSKGRQVLAEHETGDA